MAMTDLATRTRETRKRRGTWLRSATTSTGGTNWKYRNGWDSSSSSSSSTSSSYGRPHTTVTTAIITVLRSFLVFVMITITLVLITMKMDATTSTSITTTSAFLLHHPSIRRNVGSVVGTVETRTTTKPTIALSSLHSCYKERRTTYCQLAATSSSSSEDDEQQDEDTKEEKESAPTEDMVLQAVENAEKAWEAALEARKTANALVDRAEEEAEAASIVAQETSKMVDERAQQKVPVTMQQLAQVDRASSASLDATSKVNRALKASAEAERLEKIAEIALQDSERLLEDHLKSFPNSSLA